MPRMSVGVLGRSLGTATGWDGDPDCFWFEDFQPHAGIDLPAGDLQFNFAEGLMGLYNSEGNFIDPKDICETLAKYPREVQTTDEPV